jgi:hypothetical protein
MLEVCLAWKPTKHWNHPFDGEHSLKPITSHSDWRWDSIPNLTDFGVLCSHPLFQPLDQTTASRVPVRGLFQNPRPSLPLDQPSPQDFRSKFWTSQSSGPTFPGVWGDTRSTLCYLLRCYIMLYSCILHFGANSVHTFISWMLLGKINLTSDNGLTINGGWLIGWGNIAKLAFKRYLYAFICLYMSLRLFDACETWMNH